MEIPTLDTATDLWRCIYVDETNQVDKFKIRLSKYSARLRIRDNVRALLRQVPARYLAVRERNAPRRRAQATRERSGPRWFFVGAVSAKLTLETAETRRSNTKSHIWDFSMDKKVKQLFFAGFRWYNYTCRRTEENESIVDIKCGTGAGASAGARAQGRRTSDTSRIIGLDRTTSWRDIASFNWPEGSLRSRRRLCVVFNVVPLTTVKLTYPPAIFTFQIEELGPHAVPTVLGLGAADDRRHHSDDNGTGSLARRDTKRLI
ncbi:hypothetical protein EVAR_36988_1 [Eumeta japonica]|uniref:Uncharacterized protein n=1 Tax=Eumeta variegata TaxID=151549 RepID=A0A4C1X317_EUMVA|nr:hypothetical protein EVAR_36988_1 [Eumeta japonica]